MTITQATPTATGGPAFEQVAFSLYRDIHKGIRAELFAITSTAGTLDPTDRAGREDLARHVGNTMDLLVEHAEHEDDAIDPALQQHLPELADKITIDHTAIEARIEGLRALTQEASRVAAGAERATLYGLHVELAAFTSAYLAHQDFEERVVMPALQDAIGVDAVVEIHNAIVGPMPPDELSRALAVMLPAMNVDDRSDLLGGIRANAPTEAFAGIWSLAGSVLDPADVAAVSRRLEI